MKPCVSPRSTARPTRVIGRLPISAGRPDSRRWRSVMPTRPMGGSVWAAVAVTRARTRRSPWSRPFAGCGLVRLGPVGCASGFWLLRAWTRRDSYVRGFGPFPISFSTSLFIWFREDWFYLQFLMLAVGFMGKEFVRWQRDGKRVHIFNPSAFSLGLFSLVLLATNTTELTWGQEIASTLTLAPYIYSFLFLIGLIVMYFFSITLVAGSAAIMLFSLSALYGAVTGVPYFVDSEIPSAVFLGLHLLVTDPSTSPRTALGRSIFGGLYGLGVFGLYALLGALGVPTFYDKLLCVPLLNLSVQRIDGLVRAVQGSPRWNRWRRDWAPARANWAHMAGWSVFFGALSARGRTDGRHTGDSMPFWQQACVEGRRNACDRLIQLESSYCRDNSGWACNELGGHYTEGRITDVDIELATAYFSRACEVRFQAGCVNVLDAGNLSRADPRIIDLRLLLREGGLNLMEMPERDQYGRAGDHGWISACAEAPRSSRSRWGPRGRAPAVRRREPVRPEPRAWCRLPSAPRPGAPSFRPPPAMG